MTGRGRRRRTWLLVAATVALVPATIALNRAVGFDEWRLAVGWSPAALPSSSAVPADEIASGLPTLSLVLDEPDLHDPARGILANVMEHGADWEREGSVSYFEDGRLRFATGVGVRVHGGGSRITSERQGFRLYFRRRYGATQVPPGVLFGSDAQPIRRLVVHNDVRFDRHTGTNWHLANPLAYDIAEAVGAIAPDTQPVRFFLNGEYYGVFVLTERIDERFFEAHWGHGRVRLDQEKFDELWAWVSATRPLTMEAVAARVDLENLTRWFLAVAFAGTRDAYQGPGQFEDRTKDDAEWFWVNWDMDQSFRNWDLDSYQYLLERPGEPRKGRNRAEPRPTLLTNLIAEDAGFREYYLRMVQHALNHVLTPAYLEERYRHYAEVAGTLDVADRTYLPRLKEFLERRPAFFRLTTESWLNTGTSQRLAMNVPDGRVVIEDGARITGAYQGAYYPEIEARFEIPPDGRDGFDGWRVDNEIVERSPVLRLRVTRPTVVTPQFNGEQVAIVFDGPARVTLPTAPAAPLRWVRVPAAEPFEMLTHEVTAAQFAAFAASAGIRMPRQPEWFAEADHPVMNVTWDEAVGFCTWAEGRLPTEAEWLHAARGGAAGDYAWGGNFNGQANVQGTTGPDRWIFTAPVGSFAASAYGLHDMTGNVWEWTSGVYAQHPWEGYEMRVVRGASWDNTAAVARLDARAGLSRKGRHNIYVGFRCAR